MRIIIAPDKFKGSCPADTVAEAISRGWKSVFPDDETVLVPVADGGDGTLAAMRAACGGQLMTAEVCGPMGNAVQAHWLKLPDGAAVIEMAQASGLTLVDAPERNVRQADSFGTGQLILAALDAGCRRFVVGIGGSATNDGGIGMLRALGARFSSRHGALTAPGDLLELDRIDLSGLDARIAASQFVVACDVANPLCGPDGASAVYGPQKGASPGDVAHLDACLARLASVMVAQMGFDRSSAPGAGAAGGMGWALLQVCGAEMRPGIDVVLEAAGFDEKLNGASLVITGEGSLDGQTAMGKVPVGVAARAGVVNVPVAVIAGTLGKGHEAVFSMGIDCAIGIAPGPMQLSEAMTRAEELIEQAATRLARTIRVGMSLEVPR